RGAGGGRGRCVPVGVRAQGGRRECRRGANDRAERPRVRRDRPVLTYNRAMLRLGVVTLAIVSLWVGTAAGDTRQQQADKLFEEGRQLLTVDKKPAEACEKFH